MSTLLSRLARVVERSERLTWTDLQAVESPARCDFAAWCHAEGEHMGHWQPIADARTGKGVLVARVDVARDVSSDGYVWAPQIVIRFADRSGRLHLADDDMGMWLDQNTAQSMWDLVRIYGGEELADAMWSALHVVAQMNADREREQARREGDADVFELIAVGQSR